MHNNHDKRKLSNSFCIPMSSGAVAVNVVDGAESDKAKPQIRISSNVRFGVGGKTIGNYATIPTAKRFFIL
jgi:hypothetical protein